MNMKSSLEKVKKLINLTIYPDPNISEERRNYPHSGCIVDSAKLKGPTKGKIFYFCVLWTSLSDLI